MRCQHCGKLTVVHTAGKGDEFLYRCQHCRGYHRFRMAGHHGSGAINYSVTKVDEVVGRQGIRTTTGGSQ